MPVRARGRDARSDRPAYTAEFKFYLKERDLPSKPLSGTVPVNARGMYTQIVSAVASILNAGLAAEGANGTNGSTSALRELLLDALAASAGAVDTGSPAAVATQTATISAVCAAPGELTADGASSAMTLVGNLMSAVDGAGTGVADSTVVAVRTRRRPGALVRMAVLVTRRDAIAAADLRTAGETDS